MGLAMLYSQRGMVCSRYNQRRAFSSYPPSRLHMSEVKSRLPVTRNLFRARRGKRATFRSPGTAVEGPNGFSWPKRSWATEKGCSCCNGGVAAAGLSICWRKPGGPNGFSRPKRSWAMEEGCSCYNGEVEAARKSICSRKLGGFNGVSRPKRSWATE
jgi:hypothetical protein